MKTKRELQFLTYLDALERGDAEGISAFLALAEVDAELEKMLMDYHNEESPAEKSNVITPFKRKRETANRWLQGFGSGLVAAVFTLVLGYIALSYSMKNLDLSTFQWDSYPVEEETPCRAEVASENNQIMLLPDGDVNRSMTVGVNNPFVINPISNRGIVGYDAFFEGLRVTIGVTSINLRGDCTSINSPITVYPRDAANESCVIEAESLTFPFVHSILVDNNTIVDTYNEPYQQELVLLDAPVDGIYPIIDSQFDGGLPVEDIEVSTGCTNFPLLFIQPSISTANLFSETQSIALTAFHVNEQTFENGIMLYIPAINQVVVACETGTWITLPPQAATQSDIRQTPPEGFFAVKGNFMGIWQNLPTTPFLMAVPEDGEPYNIYCDLGWATSELLSYKAAYSYIPDAYYANQGITRGEHRFTSSTGQTHIFSDLENAWRVEN